jgi:hypothetical protein
MSHATVYPFFLSLDGTVRLKEAQKRWAGRQFKSQHRVYSGRNLVEGRI